MSQEPMQETQEDLPISKLGEEKRETLPFTKMLEKRLAIIFSIIVEEMSMSTALACIEIVVSFLQLFCFVYDEDKAAAKIDLFRNDVSSVLYNFRFYRAVSATNNNAATYFMVAYLLFGIQLLYTVALPFVLKYEESGRKSYGWVVRLVCFFTPTIYWVLLNPTTEFFASIFFCDGKTGLHKTVEGLTCWTGEHFVHIGFFCLFGLVYLLNVFLICVLGNDCNAYHEQNAFRRFPWRFEILFGGYRMAMSVLALFFMQYSLDWILDGVLLFCSALLIVLYLRRALFYNVAVRHVFGACLIASFWVYLNEFFYELAQATKITYSGRTITTMFGLLFMHNLTVKMQTYYDDILIKDHTSTSLSDDADVEIFLHRIIELEKGQDNATLTERELMFFQGYIFVHKSECLKPECPMNSKGDFYIPLTKQSGPKDNSVFDDHVRIKHLIQKVYHDKMRTGRSRNRMIDSNEVMITSTSLLLACAYYQIYVMGNYYNASCQLERAKSIDSSMATQCLVLQAKRAIELRQNDLNRKKTVHGLERYESLDLRDVFEYEAYLARLRKKLLNVGELQRKLCAELLLPMPDLNSIHQHGCQMIQSCEDAEAAWTQLKAMEREDSKAESVYGMYLQYVRTRIAEANEHFKMEKIISEKPVELAGRYLVHNRQAMFAEDSSIIAMGTAGDVKNRIVKCSNGISRIFEYSATDIVGKDIAILMPTFIGEEHSLFTEACLTSGRYTILNQVVESFAVDKERYLFKLHVLVKQYYDLEHGVLFLGLIHPSSKEEATIVTDMEGKVLGISCDVSEMLHELTPTLLREQDVYLFYICPQFHNKLNQHKYSEFTGTVALTFAVPKNLQTVSLAITTEHALLMAKTRPESEQRKESIEEVFRNSFSQAFEYDKDRQFLRWCSISNQSMGNGKVNIKVISFGKSDVKAAKEQKTSCVDIELAVSHDSMQLRNQRTGLKKAPPEAPLPTILDVDSPSSKTTRRVSGLVKRNKVKEALYAAICQLPGVAGKMQPATKQPSTFGEANELTKENDLEASETNNETTRRCLVPTLPAKKEEKETAEEEELEGRQEVETPTQNLQDNRLSKTSVEKEINNLRGISLNNYLPKTLTYANVGVLVFLIIIIALSVAHFVVYCQTLDKMRSLKEMTRWTRSRTIAAVYEIVKTLSLLGVSAYGVPLLDLAARNSYNYATIGYDALGNLSYTEWKFKDFYKLVNDLSNIKAKLQMQYIGVKDTQGQLPDSIQWVFIDESGKPYFRYIKLHSAISMLEDEARIAALKLAKGSTDVASSLTLVLANSYGIILNCTQTSPASSLDLISTTIDQEELISLLLLCTMISASGLCILALIPLLYSIRNDTAEMLQLLVKIKASSLKTQIENCARFISFLHHEGGLHDLYEDLERDEETPDGNDKSYDESDKLMERSAEKRRKGRSFVPYKGDFFTRILKLLAVFAVIDTYALYCYYEPPAFFTRIESHLKEIGNFNGLVAYDYVAYNGVLDIVGSNGTFMGNALLATALMAALKDKVSNAHNDFMAYHRDRESHFTSEYQNDFNTVVLSNLCQSYIVKNITECASLRSSSLAKGFLFADSDWLETYYRISRDFLRKAPRTGAGARAVINSYEMIEGERVFRKYLLPTATYMVESADRSLNSALDGELPLTVFVFILFLVGITLIYLVLWRLFMSVLKKDLFSSKLFFSYLPVELIVENPRLATRVMEYARNLTADLHS